jgi:hypothetical protein
MWPALVRLGINGCRRPERLPAELFRGLRHVIGESAAAQRRHRIFALPRRFEDIAAWIDLALQIAALAGDAYFVLHQVVERLQIVVTDGPVFKSRTFGKRARAVAPRHLAARLEIPGMEPPALRPIVNRRAPDRIHHGMNERTKIAAPCGLSRRLTRRRHLLVRFGNGSEQAADVIVKFVGLEGLGIHPRAGLDAGDLQPRPSQRQHGHAAGRSQPDDGHVNRFQTNGDVRLRKPRRAPA